MRSACIPVLGRGFEPAEDSGRNAHPVVVIAYQTWKERYHSDPNIIGRIQMLNGVKHTIVGVAPEGFYGTFVGYSFPVLGAGFDGGIAVHRRRL
jgi:hypothetical protein